MLDGLTRIPDLVKKCSDNAMPAVAVTDHGNMYGIMKLVDSCEKLRDASGNLPVKPIVGCEVYVAPKSRFDKKTEEAKDSGYHLVLLAKNPTGFLNLSKLVSAGFTEGFYYKPRIDRELLSQNSEGIVVLSGCMGGEIQTQLLNGEDKKAMDSALWFKEIFGEDFYLEIQNQGLQEEHLIIPKQMKLSKSTGIKLVATNDSHYLSQEDSDIQDTLLCIGTKALKSAPDRMRFPNDQFYVKTYEEMLRAFPDHPEFLEQTLEIADKIDVYPITRKPVSPNFPVPSGYTVESYFAEVSRSWFAFRMETLAQLWSNGSLKNDKSVYEARLEFELNTILKMGFAGYFLLVWDFIKTAREMGVPVGPGRGSAAGSIVAWSLGITDIDPIQHDLLFERFLNPERVSMPDVDIDFCRDGRQSVIDYVTKKYGKERVGNIVTISQLKPKAAIKDVSRVLGKDFAFANKITKLIPVIQGQSMSITQALEQPDGLITLYSNDPQVKEVIDVALKLEGVSRNTGVHAAGVIIAPDDLTKFAPLSRDKDGKVMVQYTMADAERAGLLKMDFLGLETLTQIKNIQNFIKKTHGAPLDMKQLHGFNDKKTFALFASGNTDGVFQFESNGMKNLLKKLQPERFEDLVALNALFRPGPLGAGMGDTYVNRRHGREKAVYIFDEIKPILEPTYGVLLYQEQVMQIAQVVSGFSLGEADMLRRAMGKKDAVKMAKEKDGFIDRASDRGFDRGKASELFEIIEYFAGYGFNKSHSAAYAMLAYETAYLKAHYPTEFMAGLLSTKSQKTEDVVKYICNCREMGIEVVPPDIRRSVSGFSISSDNQILFGLSAIIGLGDAAIQSILKARENEGAFVGFMQTLKATKGMKVGKNTWEALIKSGAFDSMEDNRAALLQDLDLAVDEVNRKEKPTFGATCLFGSDEMASATNSWKMPEGVTNFKKRQRIALERETLGLYASGHPLEEYIPTFDANNIRTISEVRRLCEAGQLRDGDTVSVGVVIRSADFKTSSKGDQFAVLGIEDMNDKMEAMVFANSFNKETKRKSPVLSTYRELLVANGLVSITGNLKIEYSDIEGEKETIKLFTSCVEPLDNYFGRGLIGASISIPYDGLTSSLLQKLKLSKGSLPLSVEYVNGSKRIKDHGINLSIKYDPDLSDLISEIPGGLLEWIKASLER